MDTDLQQTLLQLFQQVSDNPDDMPVISVDAWQQGSVEWQLLSGFRDVLERLQQSRQDAQKSAEQLREKEAEYRSIFESTIDGVLIANLDGYLVEANPAVCKMFDYSYEEFIGLHPTTFIHPDSLHLQDEHVQASRADNQHQSQGIVLRKDGSSFFAEAHTTPFLYKGTPHILAMVRDITERVRAEEQLREKEEQYRGIFEASVDGLLISDLEGEHIVEANPAICEMNGYTREELLVLPPANLLAPEYYPLVAESLQVIEQGGQFYNQAIALRKNGTTFRSESLGTTFMYKGKLHILTISRDITERVQVQEQLREKEAEYRSIFEASTDALIIASLDGYIVEANSAACKMFGYMYEEFVGLPAITIIHPDRYHEIAESIQTIQTGSQRYYAQTIGLHKDGTQFYTQARTTPFNYKGKPHLLGVVRDISERVRAEVQLREKETQYRSIFQATSDGLVIINLESGQIVEANPAACKIYGYDYDEFVGSSAAITSHPDDLPFILENVIPIIKAGGEFRAQGIGLRKDGTTFNLDVHDTAFTYQGKPHILAVVHDITELVQAYQLLEQRVEERTRELSTLLEVSHNVASTIELTPLLDLILDQLKVVVDYSGSSVTILEDENLVLVGTRGPNSEEHLRQHRFLIVSQSLSPYAMSLKCH